MSCGKCGCDGASLCSPEQVDSFELERRYDSLDVGDVCVERSLIQFLEYTFHVLNILNGFMNDRRNLHF